MNGAGDEPMSDLLLTSSRGHPTQMMSYAEEHSHLFDKQIGPNLCMECHKFVNLLNCFLLYIIRSKWEQYIMGKRR